MAARVYLLYDYDEHGPRNLVATIDRDRVLQLARERHPGYFAERHEERAEVEARLLQLADDPALGRVDLLTGWGGLCLDIVELL